MTAGHVAIVAETQPSAVSDPIVGRRSRSMSAILAFVIGVFVQISMPLTDLYEIPNVRAIFFALILGVFVLRFLSGQPIRMGSFLLMSYVGLSLILAFGLAYSRAPLYGATKVVLVCSYFWLLGAVIYNLVDEVANGKAFLAGLFLGGVLLIGILAAEFGNPIKLFEQADRFFRLRFGEEGNPIMLGRHLALAITMLITWVALRRRWIDMTWSVPLCALTFAYLLATGSKGPLLALLLSFVITPLVMLRGLAAKITLSVCLLMVSAVAAVVASDLLPKEFLEERFTEKVQNLSLRMPAYQEVMRALLESDAIEMVVGHGTGDYGYFALGKDARAYPHNVMLEVAYENGLMGVALVVVALGYPFLVVMRMSRQHLEPTHRMLLGGLTASYIAAVINAQVTGDLGANLLIGIFGAATTSISSLRDTVDAEDAPASRPEAHAHSAYVFDPTSIPRRVIGR